MTLVESLHRSLAARSHRVAIRHDGAEMTRGDLLRRAETRAAALARAGPGSPIAALDGSDTVRFLVDFLGSRLAGVGALVHPPGTPEALRARREAALDAAAVGHRTVFYSSGSLGAGKPIPLTDAQILFAASAYEDEPPHAGDRIALGVSAAFVFGLVRGALNAILAGAELVPFPAGRDPLADAEAAGGTVALLSGRHVALAARSSARSGLRLVMSGGAPVPESWARGIESRGAPIRIGYGLTESAGVATRQRSKSPRRTATSGPPASGIRVEVVRLDGKEARTGEEGEIRLDGNVVFEGYADPAEAAPFDDRGRLRTGDIGFLDEEGELVVRGRARLCVWSHGRLLCAEELEGVALEIPGIVDAAAVPLRGAFGLLLVADDVSETFRSRVEGGLAARLPAFGRPRGVRFAAAIPRLPTGKIDRVEVEKVLGRLL